jgi:hypothetical protein
LRRDRHAMVITFESSGNHWLLFIFDTEMYMQDRDLSWYRAWPAYCMVDCMSHSRIVHLYGDVTIAMLEEAAKLGPCSALMPTVTPRPGFFHRVSSEGPPHSVASFLRQTRGCGGSILTWIRRGSIFFKDLRRSGHGQCLH